MVLNVEDMFEMYFQPTVWNLSQAVKESKFNYELCNTTAVLALGFLRVGLFAYQHN